jgi:hypothetical protein
MAAPKCLCDISEVSIRAVPVPAEAALEDYHTRHGSQDSAKADIRAILPVISATVCAVGAI